LVTEELGSVFDSWRRHSGNYCNDHCSPCCTTAIAKTCPKSTRLQHLSIDSIAFKVYEHRPIKTVVGAHPQQLVPWLSSPFYGETCLPRHSWGLYRCAKCHVIWNHVLYS